MSDDSVSNVGVMARIEAKLESLGEKTDNRLNRIEDKLDLRMTSLDKKVDAVDGKVDLVGARQDRLEGKLEGSIGMLKWLGPTGVLALVYGMAKAAGLI